jgi:hypothetical protein
MTFHEPSQAIFIVSLVLFVIAWISYFAGVPFIGNHPSLSYCSRISRTRPRLFFLML